MLLPVGHANVPCAFANIKDLSSTFSISLAKVVFHDCFCKYHILFSTCLSTWLHLLSNSKHLKTGLYLFHYYIPICNPALTVGAQCIFIKWLHCSTINELEQWGWISLLDTCISSLWSIHLFSLPICDIIKVKWK